MGLTLKWVGAESDWLPLDEAIRFFAADDEAAQAEARKAGEQVAGVAVRVLTLDRAGYLSLIGDGEGLGDAKGFKAVIESEAHNAKVMRAGLHSVRGVEGVGEAREDLTPQVLDAVEASGLSWIIAQLVLRHNSLTAEQRKAFFTSAAAG